ncbi:MAG: isocitrate dehydrogenase (NADP(+)) [Planctomycetes bacterium]|nr:isocitrate dehydrogenase (NADP(+)) [Planctomycetota bacterium]MCW8137001.1 isocitrate dehydrogenase (NADP(+)) [Planctomycetota bacterium]
MADAPNFKDLKAPKEGARISFKDGDPVVPDNPIVPYIEGDGTGRDIWKASVRVLDAAVQKAYGGKRKIHWFEVYAGEKANDKYGTYLPDDTTEAIKFYGVGIKGPLTTPVGGGFRSLNVTLRQVLDLYSCVRPVKYFDGVPSPMKDPSSVDLIIYRENTEDVYSGIEWKAETPEAKKVIELLNGVLAGDPSTKGKKIAEASGIGIKPISKFKSQRHMRRALKHAIRHKINDVAIIHKGNIMKYTEGAFRDWCYELAKAEFRDFIVTEDEMWEQHNGKLPAGKILVKDRIADSAFQQILLRPAEYKMLVTMNLNGDYLSDAAAAQVGGLGIAPGANIGDHGAVFEATHGTAPKYADKDVINPGAVILSGAMMFEWMGWLEARDLVFKGMQGAISAKTVTYDFERQMPGAKKLGTAAFGDAIIGKM